MDQKVKHHETKDLDVYFAQLLGMAARKKKTTGLKVLKWCWVMVSLIVSCSPLFAWGRWLTNSLRLICSNSKLICLKTFFWKGLFLRGELPVSFREGNTESCDHIRVPPPLNATTPPHPRDKAPSKVFVLARPFFGGFGLKKTIN